jgi:hypothetical protein
MAVITCEPGWKGAGGIGVWANHESSLSDDEMIALAGAMTGIAGMTGPLQPGMHAHFHRVRNALASATDKIKIVKGIHERDSKVHFDIKISDANGANETAMYHVFVVPGAVSIHTGAPSPSGTRVQRKLAAYNPSGLSIRDGVMFTWPAAFLLADLEKPVGRPRGYSFSLGNSSAPPTLAELVKPSDLHRRAPAPK